MYLTLLATDNSSRNPYFMGCRKVMFTRIKFLTFNQRQKKILLPYWFKSIICKERINKKVNI